MCSSFLLFSSTVPLFCWLDYRSVSPITSSAIPHTCCLVCCSLYLLPCLPFIRMRLCLLLVMSVCWHICFCFCVATVSPKRSEVGRWVLVRSFSKRNLETYCLFSEILVSSDIRFRATGHSEIQTECVQQHYFRLVYIIIMNVGKFFFPVRVRCYERTSENKDHGQMITNLENTVI